MKSVERGMRGGVGIFGDGSTSVDLDGILTGICRCRPVKHN